MKSAGTGKTLRAPKVTQRELNSALEFLKSTPIGQRLQAAEYALTLLVKDRLPRLRQYIFNAGFDLREISNSQRFDQLVRSGSISDDLLQESVSGGFIKVAFEKEQILITIFYEKKLNNSEALLYSRSLGEVTAVTYAALGLDMTGLISVDGSMLKK